MEMSLPPPPTTHSIHNTLWLVLLESGAQPWTSHCGGNGSFRPLLRWTGRAMWLTHGLSRILWRYRIDKKSRCSLHYFSFQIFFFFINDWASLVTQMVKNPPAVQETWVRSLGWEDPLEEGMATDSSILGFPGVSDGKESARNAGNLSWIPGSGRSSGGGHGNPLQYPHRQRNLAG